MFEEYRRGEMQDVDRVDENAEAVGRQALIGKRPEDQPRRLAISCWAPMGVMIEM